MTFKPGTRHTGNPDPTAGVTLVPRLVRCPRCGIPKGKVSHARPGLCRDCRDALAPAERISWAA